MKINIQLIKNFATQWNKLQDEFGTDIARINGFDDKQLSYTDFIDNFIDEETVADSSIDGNSNVGHKDIVTLEREMSKPHSKLLAFNKIYYEIHKKYGFKAANEWLRMEWVGMLYMHDACSSSFKSYCFAYSLKDLAERGLFFIEGQNAQPAEHLITFIDFIKEFVCFASNRTSGAVGLPDLIPYMFYFWKKDIDNDYLGIKTAGKEKYYAKQNFQRFIYAVNQPYVRDGSQSAFSNTQVFDRPYFEALFGGSVFPNGEFMIDYEEEIIEFQKWYMEVMSDIRSVTMFTFPVSTISLLRENGKFGDEEFAEWAIKHNMKWSDSNLFIDSSVTSLSNCPMAPDTNILYYSERYHKYCISGIRDVYYRLAKANRDTVNVLSNGKEIPCKINKFDLPIEYKITLCNGAVIKTTSNHLNKVYGKDYVESKDLTSDDYLPFGLHPYLGNDQLSYEDGLLVGMFLGDGSYQNNNSVVFSLNHDKKQGLIDFLEQYCPQKYAAVVSECLLTSSISGKQSCTNISVNSMYLRGLIEMFIEGDSAMTKSLSGKAYVQSVGFRKGIIDGLYKTDGGNNNRIYTSSIKLRDTLIALMATLGMVYTLGEDNREGRLAESVCYTIRFYTPEGRSRRKDVYIVEDDYMWIKIKDIEKISGTNEAYCLEVQGDYEPVFTLANGIITHNCRLKSNIEDLGYFNSIGGTALKVGSVKVSTINLARIALDTKTEEEYLEELKRREIVNLQALDAVRHIIKRNVDKHLLPNFSYGLIDFEHLYNTIGFMGIYETMKKFGYTKTDELGNVYYTDKAAAFGEKIFKVMRQVADEFIKENECDYMINTEQIPGESAAAKLMKKDKFFYPKAKIYDLPLYGNQFIPLGIKTTLQERVRIQAMFDGFCNGGSILHANIDAPFDSYEKARKMVEYVADQGVTYHAWNTKISADKHNHAFYGETCPECGEQKTCEYTRISGFYTPIQYWSSERKAEYKLRQWEPINKTAENIM